jgi:hypothetical protein
VGRTRTRARGTHAMELRSGSVVGQEKPTSSSASSTVVGRLTNEAIAVLGEGIRLCFLRWTALQLAVENEWGGHTSKLKAQQLQSDVLSWFTRSKGKIHISKETLSCIHSICCFFFFFIIFLLHSLWQSICQSHCYHVYLSRKIFTISARKKASKPD